MLNNILCVHGLRTQSFLGVPLQEALQEEFRLWRQFLRHGDRLFHDVVQHLLAVFRVVVRWLAREHLVQEGTLQ